MTVLFHHRLLAVLTVIAILCGLGHQLFGAYERHHHCGGGGAIQSGVQSETGGNSGADDCNHAVCHHVFLAVAESHAVTSGADLFLVELLGMRGVNPSEVEPLPIDHPPQLG